MQTPEMKNGPIFGEKIEWIPVPAKMTLKMGMGFEAGTAHPIQTKLEYPRTKMYIYHIANHN